MPIPNDPHSRHWVELAGVSPDLVDQLQSTLVAFLAFDHGRVPSLAGSGFIISGASQQALVVTAKHVLTEGVHRVQRPRQSYAASALFVPNSASALSLNPERLKVAWMGARSAGLLNVAHTDYNETTDLACCVVAPQVVQPPPFEPISIPLHTTVPTVGDLVQMVSIDEMSVAELSAPTDLAGRGQAISITRRISIRMGTVTAVYPSGFRQYPWACFTTSIPAEPGMSGGFVCLPIHGTTIAACGVVCADNSSDAARTDSNLCGESVIGCTWPALGLRVPRSLPSSPMSPSRTLLDMARAGDIEFPVGGVDHIRIEETSNGVCRVKLQCTEHKS